VSLPSSEDGIDPVSGTLFYLVFRIKEDVPNPKKNINAEHNNLKFSTSYTWNRVLIGSHVIKTFY
jgi:hypothetical protein